MPSSKVIAQLVAGVLLAIAAVLARDTSWLDGLPPWLGPVVAQVLAALVAYFKAENRPAPSSFRGAGE